VNAHLWEFPNVEIGPNGFDARRLARAVLGTTPATTAPFCVIKHTITRYRITLEAFRMNDRVAVRRNGAPHRWVDRGELKRLAFTSAHRKILAQLQAQDS